MREGRGGKGHWNWSRGRRRGRGVEGGTSPRSAEPRRSWVETGRTSESRVWGRPLETGGTDNGGDGDRVEGVLGGEGGKRTRRTTDVNDKGPWVPGSGPVEETVRYKIHLPFSVRNFF